MSDTAFHHSKKPWSLTIVSLAVVAGLCTLPYFLGTPDPAKLPDWMRFIGHFHPLILHLPIGIFALIGLQEIAGLFSKRVPSSGIFPLFLGATSAVVAVIFGFFLYRSGAEYISSDLAERHFWSGLAFGIVAILTLISKSWTQSCGLSSVLYRLLLVSSLGIMTYASHGGAAMTHGENYLTEFAPVSLRRFLGAPEKSVALPVAASVYASQIAPILERRCVQCHKESKSKGKLRMDNFALLLKGGEDGPALVPGDSAKSRMIQRILLPLDDEEHMPPEGKPQVEPQELTVLRQWIDAGASGD
jgi:uncharacterized membrane protein